MGVSPSIKGGVWLATEGSATTKTYLVHLQVQTPQDSSANAYNYIVGFADGGQYVVPAKRDGTVQDIVTVIPLSQPINYPWYMMQLTVDSPVVFSFVGVEVTPL